MSLRFLLLAIFFMAANSAFAFEPSKLEWSGDLRYRMAKGHEAEDRDRSYQQLRARLGFKADVNDDTKVITRLATGTSAVSHDQTLGDSTDPGMPRRGFGIDQAYLDWKFGSAANLWAGRTANPFFAPGGTQLIYDADLAFEGIAIKVAPHWHGNTIFLNVAGYIISEEFAAPDDIVDVGLVGGDIGYRLAADTWSWTTHAGNYYFLNIQDKPITSFDKKATTDPYSYPNDSYQGNSVYPNDPLLPPTDRKYYFENKYVLLEAGTEWKQHVTALEPVMGNVDYTLFADWVSNDKVHRQGKGSDYGATVRWNRFWLSYAQTTKARDCVVGAFTDNETNGGGTDNKGDRISLGAQIGKNATLVLTQFQAKRGIDTVERNFSQTFLDATVNF